MVVVGIWLGVMLVGGAWWVRSGVAEFRRFEALMDTADRQRVYGRWLVQSLIILGGSSLVSLALAHGLWPLHGFPTAFEPARLTLHSGTSDTSGEHWLPVALGMSFGIAVSVAVQWRRVKKLLSPVRGLGDALIPRNRAEGLLCLLLSLNAGFSEELFFRLALPLLLLQFTHSLPIALGVSIVCFGLAHAHYGWKGIVATGAAGALLTFYYLSHGSLLRVMLAHALIDVIAFFLRPALVDWVAWRKPPQWALQSR